MKKRMCILLTIMIMSCILLACGKSEETPETTASSTAAAEPEQSTGTIAFTLVGKDGNDKTYSLDQVETVKDSPLQGKTIYWLGSSVTAGTGSEGQAIAHLLEKTDGTTCVIEAIAGTTLQTLESEPERSYVSRMQTSTKFDTNATVDAFFCQISTNDGTFERIDRLGEITPDDVTDLDAFDLSTTAGAVEYVIAYAHQTWNCPVYFYSGSYFGDPEQEYRAHPDPIGSNYAKIVDIVKKAAEKWDTKEDCRVGVIDLFHDTAFNELVSDSDWSYLMKDAVHPRKAGYLLWWLPKFQEFLYAEFSN